MTPISRRHVALVAALGLGVASRASAGELSLALGLDGRVTSWHGDSAAFGTLRVGYGFTSWFAAHGEARLGVGAVDERVLQSVDLGARVRDRWGRTSPYLRLGVVHQHESPGEAVSRAPISVLGGWGDGIRHRIGASGGAGIEWCFHRGGRVDWFVGVELAATVLADDGGPGLYGGGGATFGVALAR
jgi:hypothetical protein